jgi:hypothetical protein
LCVWWDVNLCVFVHLVVQVEEKVEEKKEATPPATPPRRLYADVILEAVHVSPTPDDKVQLLREELGHVAIAEPTKERVLKKKVYAAGASLKLRPEVATTESQKKPVSSSAPRFVYQIKAAVTASNKLFDAEQLRLEGAERAERVRVEAVAAAAHVATKAGHELKLAELHALVDGMVSSHISVSTGISENLETQTLTLTFDSKVQATVLEKFQDLELALAALAAKLNPSVASSSSDRVKSKLSDCATQ